MVGIIFTLVMLILLQAVLGFDNLLYISLESKKAPQTEQKRVRKVGILIAIGLRILLLFVLVSIWIKKNALPLRRALIISFVSKLLCVRVFSYPHSNNDD